MSEHTNCSPPRIIAFSGPKFSGKDTAAKILFRQNESLGASSNPRAFMKMPFAGGTKNFCHDTFGYSYEAMEDFDFKETPQTKWPYLAPRVPMMDFANWARGIYGGDVWVRRVARLIEAQQASDPYWAYIITDWRFPEETQWLNEVGALKVYIDRPSAEESLASKQADGDEMALNPSEMHFASTKTAADVVLANDREIYKLHNQVLSEVRKRFGFWYKDEEGIS